MLTTKTNIETKTNISALSNLKTRPQIKLKNNKNLLKQMHWIVTIILFFCSLFSFIWLGVLYSGIDGVKICDASQNFLCEIRFPYTKQAVVSENETKRITTISTKQKLAKNLIRNIWLEQVSLNNDLISSQQELELSVSDWKSYLQNYIRFINGESQLLNGFDQTTYTNKLTLIEEQIQNLRLKRNETAEKKLIAKDKIDQIYLELEEKQENSFVGNK